MNRDRLLLAVASVLAGTAVLLVVLGTRFNLVLVLAAIPFGAAAYFLWLDATGRLRHRLRSRARRGARARRPGSGGRVADGGRARGSRRTRGDGARRTRTRTRPPGDPTQSASRARRVLGVDADATEAEIREAYRDRVKDVHPDRDGGSAEAFKRVQAAYDRLTE